MGDESSGLHNSEIKHKFLKIYDLSEEDLCCPVCQEVFRDPVLLSCSHSFCKDCLKRWWRERPTHECPVCKKRSVYEPPLNRALKNLYDDDVKVCPLKVSVSVQQMS
uniref:RING-type domain-containing protein n=1 Tax=Maylandia zebra TaxID=106582 RepID=A0A3P9CMH3_9CICH